LHCTHDPETRGGWSADGRKVRGTLHWVSAAHSLGAKVRLYDRLFTEPDPLDREDDLTNYISPDSLVTSEASRVEPSLAGAAPGSRYQFLRHGYFSVDPDSQNGVLVFNRTVSLRDTWAKIRGQQRNR
jgi:glutaminyl-tRNA synthetase